jgi:cell wall-associated NlpC family hydrolase
MVCLGALLPLQAQSAEAPKAVPDHPSQLTTLLTKAKTFLGRPYRWGGSSPKGFDCSGFVHYVFNSIGVDLNRSSRDQSKDGDPVDLDHILPGDLLFFSTRGMRKGISHVGIYLGEGRFIHASDWGGRGQRCVKLGELASSYFAERLVAARRVILPMAEDSKVPMVEDSKTP